MLSHIKQHFSYCVYTNHARHSGEKQTIVSLREKKNNKKQTQNLIALGKSQCLTSYWSQK